MMSNMSSKRPSSSKPESDSASRVSGELKSPSGTAQPLAAGLYIVATPIGNLRDITLRALDVLAGVDLVLAEDTRVARRLLTHHGIRAKLSPYHDHNGARRRPELIAALEAGQRLALISDAGTPLVSDPGWKLAHEVIEAGFEVIPIPGPSAALAGLVSSGLPSDRFMFCGFLSPKAGSRRKTLREVAEVPGTLIFYESAQRLAASLQDMSDILGADRGVAVARELTKLFEETRRGRLAELAEQYQTEPAPKGEIVVLIGPPPPSETNQEDLDSHLLEALKHHPVKQAANSVAETFNLPKREVYQRALSLKDHASKPTTG